MIDTAHFAGFCAAHAVLGISGGAPLAPFVVILGYDGQPEVQRMTQDRLEEGVAAGVEILASPPAKTERAVLVYDSIVTYDDGEKDTIMLDARQYGKNPLSFTLAIPYRHQDKGEPFAISRPEFLGFSGLEEADLAKLLDPFFEGVETHPEGAAMWNAHMDQSAPDEDESPS